MTTYATVIISALIGVVAFMQWRTAHMKVVLDLFDRRMKVYADLERAAAEFVLAKGRREPDHSLIRDAFLSSKFLFGSDAFARINEFQTSMLTFSGIPPEVNMFDSEVERRIAMKNRNDLALAVAAEFLRDMPNIFERYLRMSQKLVRTPGEWLKDRNEKRLSYSDQLEQPKQ